MNPSVNDQQLTTYNRDDDNAIRNDTDYPGYTDVGLWNGTAKGPG